MSGIEHHWLLANRPRLSVRRHRFAAAPSGGLGHIKMLTMGVEVVTGVNGYNRLMIIAKKGIPLNHATRIPNDAPRFGHQQYIISGFQFHTTLPGSVGDEER